MLALGESSVVDLAWLADGVVIILGRRGREFHARILCGGQENYCVSTSLNPDPTIPATHGASITKGHSRPPKRPKEKRKWPEMLASHLPTKGQSQSRGGGRVDVTHHDVP